LQRSSEKIGGGAVHLEAAFGPRVNSDKDHKQSFTKRSRTLFTNNAVELFTNNRIQERKDSGREVYAVSAGTVQPALARHLRLHRRSMLLSLAAAAPRRIHASAAEKRGAQHSQSGLAPQSWVPALQMLESPLR
jgi:hypothetical protein